MWITQIENVWRCDWCGWPIGQHCPECDSCPDEDCDTDCSMFE